MRPSTRWAWFALALLLLAPPSAAWDQHRGDSSRSGLAPVRGGALDVLSNASLPEGAIVAQFWGDNVLDTPQGLISVSISVDAPRCSVLRYPDPSRPESPSNDITPCDGGTLVGYDRAHDAALVCAAGPSELPLLRSISVADGSTRWSVIPADSLAPPADGGNWQCYSGAIDADRGEAYVPAVYYLGAGAVTADRVFAVSLDTGEVRWARSMPRQELALTGPMSAPTLDPIPRADAAIVSGITLTTTGIVVDGYAPCDTQGVCQEGFAAWWDRDGNFGGIERALRGKPQSIGAVSGTGSADDLAHAVSQYAVANGPIAAAAVGTEIVLINPQSSQPVARATLAGVEPPSTNVYWLAGLWTSSSIVIGMPHSLTSYEPATLAPLWSWTEGLDWEIRDLVGGTNGEIYVVLYNAADASTMLVAIDADTGDVSARLPLPMVVPDESRFNGWYGHIIGRDDGTLVIVDTFGSVVSLGLAPDERVPRVSLSESYPAPGDPITLSLPDRGANVTRYIVQWGDGEEARAEGGVLTHAFADRGDYDVRVTSLWSDGLTGTTVQPVHVGGTPPAELTALQKAFSPEYQNWTFFVLGTLITIVGLAITVGRHRRRFAKLERELAAVEEIRMLSVQDPRGAVMALKAYRERLPSDLAKRRIDDSQYQVLDMRSARLLKVLRTRMFAPYDQRLSQRYHRLLDAAFEDAVLQPSERMALVNALEHEEALRGADRDEIVKILDDFTSGRGEFHPH